MGLSVAVLESVNEHIDDNIVNKPVNPVPRHGRQNDNSRKLQMDKPDWLGGIWLYWTPQLLGVPLVALTNLAC